MYIVMHWTKFGRYVFAVGGNVNAAIASGVNVFWTKTLCYTISGLLAGIAGVIFTSKTGSAQSNIGVAYETDAVAACVLGGTSFAGGIAIRSWCTPWCSYHRMYLQWYELPEHRFLLSVYDQRYYHHPGCIA